jgi:hypothetical protein
MKARNTKADLTIDFEATGGCKEAKVRRFERICGWEGNSAVVQATSVGRWRRWTKESEVPFVKVGFGYWSSVEGGVGIE